MAASTSKSKTLKALVVLQNMIREVLVRSVHVYQDEEGAEMIEEREYEFHKKIKYREIKLDPKKDQYTFARGGKFDVRQYPVGLTNNVWVCIFVFDRDTNANLEYIPDELVTIRNPKLAAIPSLANDLDNVYINNYKRNNAVQLQPATFDFVPRSRRTPRVEMFDLNTPLTFEQNTPQTFEQNTPQTFDLNSPETFDLNFPQTFEQNTPQTFDLNFPPMLDLNSPPLGEPDNEESN